jgi:hypothetical protein
MSTASIQQNVSDRLFGWWYALTASPVVSDDAPLRERENVRISKLTSATLLFEIVYITIVIGVAFTNNPHLLPVLIINYLCILIGIVCNRLRYARLAAILAFSTLEIGMFYNIFNLSMAGALNSYNLPLFDILVIPELIAVSLFPAWFVLPVGAFNCLSIAACLLFLPKTTDLQHALVVAAYNIYERPIAIQIVTALISYLWVSSAIQGLRRADNADEVNKLTQVLAVQQQAALQEKQLLEEGIQEIVAVHIQVANGNLDARVPLDQKNVLWSVAGSLNNLLARLQSWRQEAQQLKYVELSIQKTLSDVQQAKTRGTPLSYRRTGTILDILVSEFINTKLSDQLPYSQKDKINSTPVRPLQHQPEVMAPIPAKISLQKIDQKMSMSKQTFEQPRKRILLEPDQLD